MSIKVPEYSYLEKPHKVEGTPKESRESFYELTKSRVKLVSQEEHLKFEKDIFGHDWKWSSAVYVIDKSDETTEEQQERWLKALDISVNKDFFVQGGEDYSDLIPYAVEHEIYESWMWTKKGYQPKNSRINHLLARRRQFEMAMKDGKAERLLEFYKRVNHSFGDELDYAYQKALKKFKKN